MKAKTNKWNFGVYDVLCLCFIFAILCDAMVSGATLTNVDWDFTYNRVVKLREVLLDGNVPYYLYNQFCGAGYGDNFFYGYLLSYLFVPFVGLGKETFIKLILLASMLLLYFGAMRFTKKFAKNYKCIVFVYFSTTFIIYYFLSFGTGSNYLALGLGFLFLSYCVDFFRDGKSFIPASVIFFLIINTHLITSVLCFMFCTVLFLKYCKREKWLDYIKFALFTCFICSYFLINFLYHSYGLNFNLAKINRNLLSLDMNSAYLQNELIGGSLFLVIVANLKLNYVKGIALCSVLTFIVIAVCYKKRCNKLSIFEKYLLLTILTIFVFSTTTVFKAVDNVLLLPFQFSVRYIPYLWLVCLIICFRNVKLDKWMYCLLIISAVIDFILAPQFFTKFHNSDYDYEEYYSVMNGEYLDSSFDWNLDDFKYRYSHVTDESGNEYSFNDSKGKVVVNLKDSDFKEDTKIRLNKLWYRGYKAKLYDSNFGVEDIKTSMGESQFVTVTIPKGSDYTKLVVYYEHPFWLKVLDAVCFITVVIAVLNTIILKVYKKRR